MFLGLALGSSSIARAQTSGVAASPAWTFHVNASTYALPGEDDILQPTLAADRGALHLEARYNYEDRHSTSGLAGRNVQFGHGFTLTLTPMFGLVGGNTNGAIPALEFTLDDGPWELYSESEYVFEFNDASHDFYYNWSELIGTPTEWFSGGLALQRTRLWKHSRDVQLGPIVGVTIGHLEASAYLFNPGADDQYVVATVGVSF